MAEKKVGGKGKRASKKNERENSPKNNISEQNKSEYEDFLNKHSGELRRRTTTSVPEIKRINRAESDSDRTKSRCGEIDPYTTVNPVLQHQIFTKRSGKTPSDDAEFKTDTYNSRFELKPKLPEARQSGEESEELYEQSLPGQQTMAEFIASSDSKDNISAPIEGSISPDGNPFEKAYQSVKNGRGALPGKSEKLKAIARTAAEDETMTSDGQLVFPAFDPLFKFPQEKTDRKKRAKKAERKSKKNRAEEKPFDIDEKDIVTSRAEPQSNDAPAETKKTEEKEKSENGFFDILSDSDDTGEENPDFEINKKSDIRAVSEKLRKIGRMSIVKTCLLIFIGISLLIALSVFGSDDAVNTPLFLIFNIFCLALSCIICVKEISSGFKDLIRLRFSPEAGSLIIMLSSLIQLLSWYLSDAAAQSDLTVLSPAAVLSLIALTAPKVILSNNSRLTIGMFAGSNILTAMKSASDSGIEGSVREEYAENGEYVRYPQKAMFESGLMKKLTSAVPRPFAGNAAYIFFIALSLVAGISYGILSSSFSAGATAFTALVTVCLPTAYIVSASLILFGKNNSLSENKSSLISYRCAYEITKTKAMVFDASSVTEQESCSIHGIKTFGKTDPKKATLCCASLIAAAKSPLEYIMNQVLSENDETTPEADDVEVKKHSGISGTVENDRVLLGTREFLAENNVFVPDNDFEEKFAVGDRRLLYLAVNGEFCMLLTVSYHIKRSVAAFFKYLSKKGIKLIVYSSDPNITAPYIEKKCKLDSGSVFEMNDAQSSYFRDKQKKTETSVSAEPFTDGNLSSAFTLFKSAYALTGIKNFLPMLIYALSAVSAVITALLIFSGCIGAVNNLYIIIFKIICFAASVIAAAIYSKKEENLREMR